MRDIVLAPYLNHIEYGVRPNAHYRQQRPARPLRAGECYDVLADSHDGTGGVSFMLAPDGRVREVRP